MNHLLSVVRYVSLLSSVVTLEPILLLELLEEGPFEPLRTLSVRRRQGRDCLPYDYVSQRQLRGRGSLCVWTTRTRQDYRAIGPFHSKTPTRPSLPRRGLPSSTLCTRSLTGRRHPSSTLCTRSLTGRQRMSGSRRGMEPVVLTTDQSFPLVSPSGSPSSMKRMSSCYRRQTPRDS